MVFSDVKEEKLEKEIRKFHMLWLSIFIAKVISIQCEIYGTKECHNYREIYNTCLDTIVYDENDKEKYIKWLIVLYQLDTS